MVSVEIKDKRAKVTFGGSLPVTGSVHVDSPDAKFAVSAGEFKRLMAADSFKLEKRKLAAVFGQAKLSLPIGDFAPAEVELSRVEASMILDLEQLAPVVDCAMSAEKKLPVIAAIWCGDRSDGPWFFATDGNYAVQMPAPELMLQALPPAVLRLAGSAAPMWLLRAHKNNELSLLLQEGEDWACLEFRASLAVAPDVAALPTDGEIVQIPPDFQAAVERIAGLTQAAAVVIHESGEITGEKGDTSGSITVEGAGLKGVPKIKVNASMLLHALSTGATEYRAKHALAPVSFWRHGETTPRAIVMPMVLD